MNNIFEKLRKLVRRPKGTASPYLEETPVPFTAGRIYHHHQTPSQYQTPPQYLLLALSANGKLVPYADESVLSKGYLTCTCKLNQHPDSEPKFINFVKEFHPLEKDHYISSKYVLPQPTEAQALSNECTWLFYRMEEDETETNMEELLVKIATNLTKLTENVDTNAYEDLYLAVFEASAPPQPEPKTPHIPMSVPILPWSQPPSPPSPMSSTSTDRSFVRAPNANVYQHLNFQQSPPLAHPNTLKSNEAVIIHPNQQNPWEFNLPCSVHISPAVREKLQQTIDLALISNPESGIAIYLEHPAQITFCTVPKPVLKTMPQKFKAVTCNNITYTVIPQKYVLGKDLQPIYTKKLSSNTDKESLFRWFILICNHIRRGSLFHTCATCNATFEHKKEHTDHVQSTHNKQDHRSRSKAHQAPHQTSSSSSDSDHEQKFRRRRRYSSNSNSNSIHSVQDPIHPTHSATKTPQGGIIAKELYEPLILSKPQCPIEYHTFWNMKGRSDPPPLHHNPKAQFSRKHVAPKFPRAMLELERVINYPNLLEDEFVAYAKVYKYIFRQDQFTSIESTNFLQIDCYNDAKTLQTTGKTKTYEELRKSVPVLESKTLATLSESRLENFFFNARSFTLTSAIPVESFPDYFLTSHALGTEIHTKVKETLLGFPEYRLVLKRFTVYLERIIRTLLPAQEPFNDAEERIILEHKAHLLSSQPSIEYTRTKLQADASDLLMKSPHYIQTRDSMSVESKRSHIEGMKANLLAKIVAQTPFEASLYKLACMDTEFKKLEQVPYQILLDRLQNLILADQKSDIALVNASRLTSRSLLRSPKDTPRNKARSPASPRRTQTSPKQTRARTRSTSKSPFRKELEPLCDVCKRFLFPQNFCKAGKHCRVKGHQPTYKNDSQFHQALQNSGNAFILHENCKLCNPEKYNWITRDSHHQASNQVSIPNTFFNQPYQLHPQSVQDIAKNTPPYQFKHPSLQQFNSQTPFQQPFQQSGDQRPSFFPPFPPIRAEQAPSRTPPNNQPPQHSSPQRNKSPRRDL